MGEKPEKMPFPPKARMRIKEDYTPLVKPLGSVKCPECKSMLSDGYGLLMFDVQEGWYQSRLWWRDVDCGCDVCGNLFMVEEVYIVPQD